MSIRKQNPKERKDMSTRTLIRIGFAIVAMISFYLMYISIPQTTVNPTVGEAVFGSIYSISMMFAFFWDTGSNKDRIDLTIYNKIVNYWRRSRHGRRRIL
jgi:hypothetical protein